MANTAKASQVLPGSLLGDISAKIWLDETEAVKRLQAHLAPVQAMEPEIRKHAASLVTTLREKGTGSGVEAFLHEYGLDTREGVAIMCLAEALLRIPDAETADRLIRDKFEHAEWDHHLGGSDSLFVNASSWGLLLTGKVVNLGADTHERPANILGRMVGKFGEPVIREALKRGMRFIGGQFVMGETIKEALSNAKSHTRKGYRLSYDILGEGARSDAQAQHYVQAYREAIDLIGEQAKGMGLFEAPSISVKLSALHPRYSMAQEKRVMEELKPRLLEILKRAKERGLTVAIDAEEATRLDIELKLFADVFADPAFAGWEGLGFVVQAYQKRAFYLIDFLVALSRAHGRRIPLRLVKGAYWDSEIKWSQVLGLPGYPVFTRKEHTDVSYLACADKMLAAIDCFYPQFATHNARTIATVKALAKRYGAKPGSFELQRLHGMGEKLHDLVVDETPSRIYAPVGQHKDLLAYLIRRLLENGANTSFVNLLMDKERPLDEIIADPLAVTAAVHASPNPQIPLPRKIYGQTRLNSEGIDLGSLAHWEKLSASMQPFTAQQWSAGKGADVHEPAERTRKVGTVSNTTPEQLETAIKSARAAFPAWAATPVEKRAAILEKLADSLEEHRAEFMVLLAREAGKTLMDGNAEVREAADFCRYYAWQARKIMAPETLAGPTGESNRLFLYPRGVFACISPWNFPLAIFAGQVTAALATGNCVLAKPAGQTPLVAARAVELMHAAGIPKDAVQLLPGSGSAVGAPLAADERIDGVVFTGSVETAQRISRSLANRKGAIVPLIAETGGQNCMVVDSSALLEQAVDDITLSAFGSAGQRCSALRVLYVQEDVADDLLTLLAGAMQELKMGYPLELATDIGPVIDEAARDMLLAHIEKMKKSARLIASVPLPDALKAKGLYVAPHAFEIKNIRELAGEVFGPVLHVIRFKADEMQRVAGDINSTGFGLTFGMHSRIEDNVDFFMQRIRTGNLYINRSMIGATVGVQPFGGEGLSGTGPKAGGPHYLLRFVTERTQTVNTAAIGGNLALLSGGT